MNQNMKCQCTKLKDVEIDLWDKTTDEDGHCMWTLLIPSKTKVLRMRNGDLNRISRMFQVPKKRIWDMIRDIDKGKDIVWYEQKFKEVKEMITMGAMIPHKVDKRNTRIAITCGVKFNDLLEKNVSKHFSQINRAEAMRRVNDQYERMKGLVWTQAKQPFGKSRMIATMKGIPKIKKGKMRLLQCMNHKQPFKYHLKKIAKILWEGLKDTARRSKVFADSMKALQCIKQDYNKCREIKETIQNGNEWRIVLANADIIEYYHEIDRTHLINEVIPWIMNDIMRVNCIKIGKKKLTLQQLQEVIAIDANTIARYDPKNQYYVAKNGIAMGSPLSPILANAVRMFWNWNPEVSNCYVNLKTKATWYNFGAISLMDDINVVYLTNEKEEEIEMTKEELCQRWVPTYKIEGTCIWKSDQGIDTLGTILSFEQCDDCNKEHLKIEPYVRNPSFIGIDPRISSGPSIWSKLSLRGMMNYFVRVTLLNECKKLRKTTMKNFRDLVNERNLFFETQDVDQTLGKVIKSAMITAWRAANQAKKKSREITREECIEKIRNWIKEWTTRIGAYYIMKILFSIDSNQERVETWKGIEEVIGGRKISVEIEEEMNKEKRWRKKCILQATSIWKVATHQRKMVTIKEA
jgi:hypothetical protein